MDTMVYDPKCASQASNKYDEDRIIIIVVGMISLTSFNGVPKEFNVILMAMRSARARRIPPMTTAVSPPIF
jgi:hypothetical protein